MGIGMLLFAVNMIKANWPGREQAPDDPYGADTLEWATSSPAPNYNFVGTMQVASPEPLWDTESVLGRDHVTGDGRVRTDPPTRSPSGRSGSTTRPSACARRSPPRVSTPSRTTS